MRSRISGTIPATANFFNLSLMFSLIRFGRKSPNLGLILIKTLPYCGGTNSSPPKTEIDFQFISGLFLVYSRPIFGLFWF